MLKLDAELTHEFACGDQKCRVILTGLQDLTEEQQTILVLREIRRLVAEKTRKSYNAKNGETKTFFRATDREKQFQESDIPRVGVIPLIEPATRESKNEINKRKIAIADELSSLHEKMANGEITMEEFTSKISTLMSK